MLAKGEKSANLKYSAVTLFVIIMLTAILYLQFQIYNLGTMYKVSETSANSTKSLQNSISGYEYNHQIFSRSSDNNIELENLSKSVCLIQGEYVFVDSGGEQVGWDDVQNIIYAANSTEQKIEEGEKISVQYTGSGFLVDDKGHIVTNKHVAMPWIEKNRDIELIRAGFSPKHVMFRAFFPGIKTPYSIELAVESENEDLAVLKLNGQIKQLTPLSLCQTASGLDMGDPVIVLGYPTGFDLLSARIDTNSSVLIYDDFTGLGQALADSELIYPMATRGICGQRYPERIAYDALTAIGASGSPVLNSSGEVVAVNTALLKGFAGTNFGVPVDKVILLLEEVQFQDY